MRFATWSLLLSQCLLVHSGYSAYVVPSNKLNTPSLAMSVEQ
jgi:hypothetical protein